MKTTTERGYGHRWRKLREAALDRDQGLCVACLEHGRIASATEVDHVKPKALGGDDSISNLQSLCRPCHEGKTARENGALDMSCDPRGIPLNPNRYWGRAG